MAESLPLVPTRLVDRPTVGGLVIPWVTVTLADGSPDWRACVRHRVNWCIERRLCQLDGQRIDGVAVFLAAEDQLPTTPGAPVITDIPPVHPECSAYAVGVCPMLNGRATAYADRPRRCVTASANRCVTPGCACGGYVSVDDRDISGVPAPRWFAVWAADWAMTPPDSAGARFAVIDRPRRIRPIGSADG